MKKLGKILMGIGLFLFILGFLLEKMGLRKLPGDIFIKGENITLFIPLASSLIISLILTIIIKIFK